MTANEFFQKYPNAYINFPIDPEYCIKCEGIDIQTIENPAETNICCEYIPKNSEHGAIIKYNDLMPTMKKNFALAHALGCYYLYKNRHFRRASSSFVMATASKTAREANIFAMKLLIPIDYLESAIMYNDARSVQFLADDFHVSAGAMSYRLRSLGYVLSE